MTSDGFFAIWINFMTFWRFKIRWIYRHHDKEARREFIQGNLRLVLSVIQRFHNRGESVDDLFQVGCIGLIKAIDNFDTGQNVRFSTYAVPIAFPCRNSQCMRRGGDARRQNLKSTVILPSLTITALSHSSTTARRSA